jgi:hypothetical protein
MLTKLKLQRLADIANMGTFVNKKGKAKYISHTERLIRAINAGNEIEAACHLTNLVRMEEACHTIKAI